MFPWSPDILNTLVPFTSTSSVPIEAPYIWYWNLSAGAAKAEISKHSDVKVIGLCGDPEVS
jgi:hypothetical protein